MTVSESSHGASMTGPVCRAGLRALHNVPNGAAAPAADASGSGSVEMTLHDRPATSGFVDYRSDGSGPVPQTEPTETRVPDLPPVWSSRRRA